MERILSHCFLITMQHTKPEHVTLIRRKRIFYQGSRDANLLRAKFFKKTKLKNFPSYIML